MRALSESFPDLFSNLATLYRPTAEASAKRLKKALVRCERREVSLSEARERFAAEYGLTWFALLQRCDLNQMRDRAAERGGPTAPPKNAPGASTTFPPLDIGSPRIGIPIDASHKAQLQAMLDTVQINASRGVLTADDLFGVADKAESSLSVYQLPTEFRDGAGYVYTQDTIRYQYTYADRVNGIEMTCTELLRAGGTWRLVDVRRIPVPIIKAGMHDVLLMPPQQDIIVEQYREQFRLLASSDFPYRIPLPKGKERVITELDKVQQGETEGLFSHDELDALPGRASFQTYGHRTLPEFHHFWLDEDECPGLVYREFAISKGATTTYIDLLRLKTVWQVVGIGRAAARGDSPLSLPREIWLTPEQMHRIGERFKRTLKTQTRA